MLFTSVSFVVFFAVVFFGYYALPHRFRWMLLLAASWTFYGWMSPYYLIFLAFATIVTYFAAVAMDAGHCAERLWITANGKSVSRDEKRAYKDRMDGRRRRWCGGAIFALLTMLAVFKYLEFLLDNVAWLSGILGLSWRTPATNLILPIGLSFYVFQSIGYLIDVLRGEVPAERRFFRHALFVSYFPQIMQGPIGNYGRLAHQFFEEHPFAYEQVVMGLQRVAWGFFKKVVIANRIANYTNPAWTDVSLYSGFMTWFFICFLYAIQLYADFSGYMDIACGCSQMLGIKLDENFNCPYFSRGIPEFWRRWHMTLGEWFKNYLFYPVLRSDWNQAIRKRLTSKYFASLAPTAIALSIVWFMTGLWHGASWGYVAWGVYYGLLMILALVLTPVRQGFERICPRLTASVGYAVFQVAITFLIVVFGYSIFKPGDLSVTMKIWGSMASAVGIADFCSLFREYPPHSWVMLLGLTGCLFVVDVIHYFMPVGTIRLKIRALPSSLRWCLYFVALFILVKYGMWGESSFEYFRF